MKATEADSLAQTLIDRDHAHAVLVNLKIRQNMGDEIDDAMWAEAGDAYVDLVGKLASQVSQAQRVETPLHA